MRARHDYVVHEYEALEPPDFNMVFGVDALIRFKRQLMLKIGYEDFTLRYALPL
jgi:hypothetical protein